MLREISRSDIADLAAMLKGCNYGRANLQSGQDTARPPTAAEMPRMLFATRYPTLENALLRLFLIGASLSEELARDTLPHSFLEMSLQNGILEIDDGRVQANIVIVTVEGLLFASDALRLVGAQAASDFVLPATSNAAGYLLRLMIRDPVDRTLDLGCGCGVHALIAAKTSGTVVATDISESAIKFTEFNAHLNDIRNVECRAGNWFDPVTGETFDNIISNPPFVMGPAQQFTYRDNPMELDGLCRQIVRSASAHLNDGGRLQLLCEWAEIVGESWQERIAEWVEGTGCDAWILRSRPRDPGSYVAGRVTDLSGDGVDSGASYDEWLTYFLERKVRAIHRGMFLAQRRGGKNWFRIYSMLQQPAESIGAEIARNLSAQDFLAQCQDDDSLLEAVLCLSAGLQLEQTFSRESASWQSDKNTLRLAGGLPMDTELDLPILAFLNQFDGQRSLRECIERFCAATGAQADQLTPELVAAMRMLLGNGFIEPVEPQ